MLIVSGIFLMILLFVVLLLLLRSLLNKEAVSSTSHLEQLSIEYTKKEEQIKNQLDQTQQECKQMVIKAHNDVQQQRETIFKEAQEEKEKILNTAQEKADDIVNQAERTRQSLLNEINKRIDERATQRAVELIQQVFPENIREDIHHRWIAELINSSFQQLDRLHLPEGELQIKVVTAFSLTDDQREALKGKIRERLQRDINFEEEIDAKLIIGVVVNIGSLVLDGSLRFKIQEITRK